MGRPIRSARSMPPIAGEARQLGATAPGTDGLAHGQLSAPAALVAYPCTGVKPDEHRSFHRQPHTAADVAIEQSASRCDAIQLFPARV